MPKDKMNEIYYSDGAALDLHAQSGEACASRSTADVWNDR
jgi:hypothetical protein